MHDKNAQNGVNRKKYQSPQVNHGGFTVIAIRRHSQMCIWIKKIHNHNASNPIEQSSCQVSDNSEHHARYNPPTCAFDITKVAQKNFAIHLCCDFTWKRVHLVLWVMDFCSLEQIIPLERTDSGTLPFDKLPTTTIRQLLLDMSKIQTLNLEWN
uniref:FAR1 domain-containing protein n=1 Tax=Panagrellus redivivus TaxID=6233 RepID=A0A7E4VL24_PANRE